MCHHGQVTRVLAVVLVVVAAGLFSGCASDRPVASRATAAAPPQTAALGWDERTPAKGPGLVFRANRLEVTKRGWEVEVEIHNQTSIAYALATDPVAVARHFGLMLFATGTLAELEQRNADRELPAIRSARSFDPPLPRRLGPGARWRGTIAAEGALAAGRFVRVVFGPLVAEEDAGALPDQLVWITDHAYRLRG